jgi:hypothetical protein
VDQDLCAWWCQRCLVEIKGTVELCFGREFLIDARGTEEIQGGGGLFDELLDTTDGVGNLDRCCSKWK